MDISQSTAKRSSVDGEFSPIEAQATESSSTHCLPLPAFIVGIGASAGGLEALETFFNNMPAGTGLAFVVVQHLSPDFRSLMDELLSRHTRIPIHRVEDGMLVEPDAIYLIPPKKEMIISGGRLLLTDKDPSAALSLPIDTFFRSLAQDCGDRAIGIILSGTCSDGSRGIRAIHEAGGLVVTQSEDTAKFDGMPRSAIETGIVDIVLSPAEMADALVSYMQQPHADRLNLPADLGRSDNSISAVYGLLRTECGIDFSHYKPSTVLRRIDRRLQLNHSLDLAEYIQQLRTDPAELNSLYKDLLIGVTRFFRDPDLFARLEQTVIPEILSKVAPDAEIRAWVAGCATGEEAYSLAILLHEALTAAHRPIEVKIFATDVHRASLEHASVGVYSEEAISEASQARRRRYFAKTSGGFQVSQDLRKMIVFAPHNVIKDAPFTKLDFISCRNLLIYLQPAAQRKALSLFHFGLKPGAVLVLGPSESPGDVADEFEVLDGHWKIYRKRRDVRLPADMRLPMTPSPIVAHSGGLTLRPPPRGGLPDAGLIKAYDELLAAYVPPSLLVNERRELIHAFGGAGKYLRIPDGRPSSDVLDLVEPTLRLAIGGAIQRAAKDACLVRYSVATESVGQDEQLKVCVRPITARVTGEHFFLISIESEPRPRASMDAERSFVLDASSQEHLHEVEQELRYTKENLQATVEEMETTNEELQATNEELVASNEELQSTNEELHSVNEELYTVNAEYQRKIVELTELTDDMDNLLRSTEIGTIFLDHDLLIRKFTPQVVSLFQLMPQDIGRPLDHFANNILYDGLLADVRKVLETYEPIERDVQTRSGNWYLLRILPYRSKGATSGVVLTLIDVSRLKRTEEELRRMSKVFMDGADPILIEDLEGRIIDLNDEAQRAYGWSREELLGKSITMLVPPEHAQQSQQLREQCRSLDSVRNVESLRCDRNGTTAPVLLTLSRITDDNGQPAAIATISKDITAQKRAEEEARQAANRRDQFLAMLSHELRNPLGAMLNAVRLLNRTGNKDDFARAYEVVERQASQMSRLLDDLLDVARITQGKIQVRKEVLDLRSIVEEAIEVVRPFIDEQSQSLSVDLPPDEVFVDGDPNRLLQVQENLLANSVKYTPSHGNICVSLTQEAKDAVLRVRDNGQGIAPEMLDKIFELFVQDDMRLDRRGSGMGIGLTLVRSIVQLHGGQVLVRSAGIAQGSEFEIRLPLTDQRPAARRPNQPPPRQKLRVMLIEDNADSREMLAALLALDGHDVRVAADGATGSEKILAERPDIALVDIGLPGIDGYEVARRVRAALGSSIRLVALTGYGRSEDRARVLEAGFDTHLVKPVQPNVLARALYDASPSASTNDPSMAR